MKGLLQFEMRLARVEGWILAAALISMLSLAVYGIVYRNAVVPLVTYLQTSDVPPPAGEDEYASDFDAPDEPEAAAPAAPAPAAAQEAPESDFDSDFGGDEPAEPTVGAAAAPPTPPAPPPVMRKDSSFVRFLLWFNFDWLDIVLRHLILWVAFFGGALATQRRKHIAIDALARRLPTAWRPTVALLVSVVSLVVCIALASAAARFTLLEASHGRPLFGAVPGWVGPVIIPIGFGLIAIHYGFRVLEAAMSLAGKHELPQDVLEVTLQ